MAMFFNNGTARPCIQFVIHLWYLAGAKGSATINNTYKATKKLFYMNENSFFYAGFIQDVYETVPRDMLILSGNTAKYK